MDSNATDDDDRTVIRTAAEADDAVAPLAAAAAVAEAEATSSDSGNALPPGTLLGEFELAAVLGEGGFGIVYVAQDHSLQRRVALKEYMPASLASRNDASKVQVRSRRHQETFDAGLKSFVNEARLLAQFDHPSLVKVYRFWEANGTAYMVMPLYEGSTLKDTLRTATTVPDEGWLIALLASLTEALAVLHAEDCFHRDIAPDNVILLAGTGRPLLLDFGAARRVIGDMTQALTVILKPGYAPVEQYAESPELKQGAWTDIYALAASIHFAILGKTPPASVSRLLNDSFVPLAQTAAGRYSPGFLEAIDKALAVRPEDRTQNIAEFRADLGLPALGAHTADAYAVTTMRAVPSAATPQAKRASATPPPPPTLPPNTPRSRKLPVVGGAVALVVVGAVAFYMTGIGRTGPAPAAPAASSPARVDVPAAKPAISAPPAITPPAARSFEIQDEFAKVVGAQTAGYSVSAVAVKSQLRVGRDRLGFSVTSARAGYVNVLVLGPDGSLMLLFPNAQSSDSRIKAGQTLKLPQASWPLDTSEPVGAERFLVIVSAQPRDYSELGKERDYIFLKLPTGKAGSELAAGWTRGTPLLLGGLKACPTADCEAYGAATFDVEIVH